MKDELISFETAKLTKEKGFNIPCIKYYEELDPESTIAIEEGWKYTINSLVNRDVKDWNKTSLHISAPTQSLLQKWLREIHDITIWFSDWEIKEYSVHICQKEETKFMPNKSLGTYEQALEIGLFESLKLI